MNFLVQGLRVKVYGNTLAVYQKLFCHRLTQTKAGQRPISHRALRDKSLLGCEFFGLFEFIRLSDLFLNPTNTTNH